MKKTFLSTVVAFALLGTTLSGNSSITEEELGNKIIGFSKNLIKKYRVKLLLLFQLQSLLIYLQKTKI